MKDPRRWTEAGSEATDLERTLLRDGRGIEPPAGEQQRVWAMILPLVGPSGGGGGVDGGGGGLENVATATGSSGAGAVGAKAAGSALANAVGLGTVWKWTAVGAVSAAALVGTNEVAKAPPRSVASPAAIVEPSRAPRPTEVGGIRGEARMPDDTVVVELAPSVVAVPSHARAPAMGSTTRSDAPPAALAPSPVTPVVQPGRDPSERSDPASSSASKLSDESRLLAQVRSALRAQNAPVALSLLQATEERFPRGALTQEREALLVETLARLGRGAEAQARAQVFLSAWPDSPYADVVRPYAR